jgi:hypothetical protein
MAPILASPPRSCSRTAARGGEKPDLAVPELPRAPWEPVLLRKDADTVYPEDRSASAARDALNVDRAFTLAMVSTALLSPSYRVHDERWIKPPPCSCL